MKYRKYEWLRNSLIIFVIFQISVFSQTFTTQISGFVRHGGAGIPNVTVSVTNSRRTFTRRTVSNTEGFFRLTELPVDRYTIRAEAPGLGSRLKKITVLIGQTSVFDIDLEATGSPATLKGKVTDKKKNVIKDVTLTLTDKFEPDDEVKVQIDENGNYNISDLVPGKYILLIESQNYKTLKKEIEIFGEKTVNVKLKKKK
jgi:hypothetical protein